MKKKLTFRETILVASTLFGMFFGAGNLIFPVHMGQLAGANILQAIIGFIVTGVGIPILAVAAIGNTYSDGLQDLANKVGKKYGIIFTCLLYLTIGPFFAIPRCATVSFTVGIGNFVPEGTNTTWMLLAFSAVFFALVLFFSLRPNGIMTWIGKIINPIFLIFLAVLVIVSLTHPSASASEIAPADNYITKPFFQGFIEGYGTMDAIAGLAFGIVVINIIRNLGIEASEDLASQTMKSGIFAGILMAVIYVLTTIMGAQSRGLFETSANGGIALGQIANHYLGTAGQLILAITIFFACLKTSIGLVTSCSETFVKMFPGKLSYNKWAVAFSVFSFVVSNVGLNALINWSLPVLMFLYPLTISIIILALCDKLFGGARSVYVCTTAGALIAALFDFVKYLPFGVDMSFASKFIPFFDLGLGWVVPSVVGFIIGLVLRKKSAK